MFTYETFLANGEGEQDLKIPRSTLTERHTYLHMFIFIINFTIAPVILKASGCEFINIYNEVTF